MTDAATTTASGCVHCQSPLVLRRHETIELLACPSEHGVFIHSESLKVAVRDRTDDRPVDEEQAAEATARSWAIEELESTEGTRACPACSVEMRKQVFAYESGVPMDVCDEHGIWLDSGELQRIEAWYEAQERYRDADRLEWGGRDGKLEQIEADFERTAANDEGSMHWGPVGWFVRNLSYAVMRRDDVL
jgi:Zn-finger nucleic acid-binding protein